MPLSSNATFRMNFDKMTLLTYSYKLQYYLGPNYPPLIFFLIAAAVRQRRAHPHGLPRRRWWALCPCITRMLTMGVGSNLLSWVPVWSLPIPKQVVSFDVVPHGFHLVGGVSSHIHAIMLPCCRATSHAPSAPTSK